MQSPAQKSSLSGTIGRAVVEFWPSSYPAQNEMTTSLRDSAANCDIFHVQMLLCLRLRYQFYLTRERTTLLLGTEKTREASRMVRCFCLQTDCHELSPKFVRDREKNGTKEGEINAL